MKKQWIRLLVRSMFGARVPSGPARATGFHKQFALDRFGTILARIKQACWQLPIGIFQVDTL
jgi:hypothetical protein